jgi:hypothetical protein
MSFKISNVKKAKTSAVPVVVLHPTIGELVTDEGQKVTLWIYGKASDQYRDYTEAQTDSFIAKQQAKVKSKPTGKQLLADRVKFIAAMTKDIEHLVADDGSKYDNTAALEELYSKRENHWLLEFAETALEDNANFF